MEKSHVPAFKLNLEDFERCNNPQRAIDVVLEASFIKKTKQQKEKAGYTWGNFTINVM